MVIITKKRFDCYFVTEVGSKSVNYLSTVLETVFATQIKTVSYFSFHFIYRHMSG
jgi:hypothetical protein